VLGVHIAAGTLWFAQVDADGAFVDDRVIRLDQSEALGETRALSEIQESFGDLLRRLGPRSVAVLKPGSGSQQAPKDLLRRGRLEGAVMVASHRAGTRVEMVTHNAVEKLVGVRPSDRSYGKRAAGLLSCEPPNRWASRAAAFGAAAVVAARNAS
jgi:hypothetical protein